MEHFHVVKYYLLKFKKNKYNCIKYICPKIVFCKSESNELECLLMSSVSHEFESHWGIFYCSKKNLKTFLVKYFKIWNSKQVDVFWVYNYVLLFSLISTDVPNHLNIHSHIVLHLLKLFWYKIRKKCWKIASLEGTMKYDMSIHLHKTPLHFIISVVSLSPSFLVFNKHGGKGGGGVGLHVCTVSL